MIEDFAGRLLRDVARLDPCAAVVEVGEQEVDGLTDYSPDGHQARADLAASALRELETLHGALPATSPLHAHLVERLRARIAFHDAGEDLRELHAAATGPLQLIRQSVEAAVPGRDAEGAAYEDGWARVGARQAAIPAALDGYARSLLLAAERGHLPARRQVELVTQRCRNWVDDDIALVERYGEGRQRASLQAAAQSAREAYQRLAAMLTADLAPQARSEEAFGPQRYALWVRTFLAIEPELRELYDWGWDEFSAIEAELGAEAKALGGSVPEVLAWLDSPDAPGTLHSRAAFGAWLQELLEATTEQLHGAHFDIPTPLRHIESRVTMSAGTGYTGPSQDLTRPGRVWWFLPEDQASFPTWYAYSTAYHEGVPGHHLQIGYEACQGGLGQRLNLLGGLSGCQEGWALYAERFMDELGLYEQPGARLGYLFMQLLRAARVVLDIGLHLRLPVPSGGGASWTPDAALQLLRDRCHQGPYASVELARYLGRPGQALTYKVGERVWLAGRSSFRGDRRAFHRRALELGSLGLDQLTGALTGCSDAGPGD
ncbi:Uncharacterized conserved protein, DUF885 familyt [Micromonospora purpureochromogenes]|uniref:Uncharacterized conserved protein, DUF885 familyt n=1 Tax=Micromonospora purpureochromogenes TaxID=47872 RepID=A0A1C4UM58_9ACTN|nr:DUF885 domain-containing protein [Micromonospora purpureochromogenes]SCE72722.1 Uncharacterized conserved protein, DUF885 familyt [Micromonospora purpureochromogenes]